MISRRELGAAVAAALSLLLSPGCGSSTSAYIPNAATARDDLDAALAAWQKGGKPAQLMKGERPINFVDSQWESGLELESYQILEEAPSPSETEKRYGVVLKMKKPPAEKRLEYVAVGRSPMWIFRDEDYVKQGGMGEEPRAKANVKRSPARGR
ncbi:hypothetical protein [Aquisphaera insulae]|uniref:hypothetical protein n=1 Tax=Aquisphaera insulae TaxID=2712864 RepID=UPI0013ED01D5|nr:hypothetical protein [Aquisphaera insulae]